MAWPGRVLNGHRTRLPSYVPRLRTAITKACRATGTPHFSPHGLRRRRGSLYYKRTGSLAEVAELLGDSKRVAADRYVDALTGSREVDLSIASVRAKQTT